MIPEPNAHLVGSTCPCCHRENIRLYPCLGCDWRAAVERQESRKRLDQICPGSGRHAYNPTGCRVCDTCRRQMTRHPSCCPLRLFHDLGQAGIQTLGPGMAGLPAMIRAQWARWLAERGWPEQTEAFWRRLLRFRQAEREP